MKMISVTRALNPFSDFSKIPPDILNYASDRGSRVHAACAEYALDHLLGVDSILTYDWDVSPFFDSFKRWFDDYVQQVFFVEEEFADPTLGFFGHPDLGVELIDGRKVVPDLKTPATESPTWKAQLAAYIHLVNQSPKYGGGFSCGFALQLHREGRLAIAREYNYFEGDFAAFLSSLNSVRYFLK